MFKRETTHLKSQLNLSGIIADTMQKIIKLTDDEQPSNLLDELLREVERTAIETAMKVTNNNKTKAANLLGISRNTLRKKIEELRPRKK